MRSQSEDWEPDGEQKAALLGGCMMLELNGRDTAILSKSLSKFFLPGAHQALGLAVTRHFLPSSLEGERTQGAWSASTFQDSHIICQPLGRICLGLGNIEMNKHKIIPPLTECKV